MPGSIGLSLTGMRERYLEVFDAIRIDCLNGDKYKTGKVALTDKYIHDIK